MKTPQDPRHQKRIAQVKELFSVSFSAAPAGGTITGIVEHLPHVDAAIADAAPQWPIDKIAKIDLAILRLAAYELLVEKNTPPKVIIDEAIELAKEFGNDASPAFVNGVMGTVLKRKEEERGQP